MKKLYAVGLGPGDGQTITPQAAAAIAESQTVCGYTVDPPAVPRQGDHYDAYDPGN